MTNTLDYLKKLVQIPSPTGFTHEASTYVSQTLKKLGYQPTITPKGNVIVTIEGVNSTVSRYITAHIDTLGAIVRAIKPSGRLKMDLIGGYSYHAIEGENCTIHCANHDKTYTGTILMHQTSVHVYADAKTAARNQTNMEIRLDEKVFSTEDVQKLGIEVGDFISLETRLIETESGFIKSRHLDDKVSAAILLNLLKTYKEQHIQLPYTTHFSFSVNEEIGYGANSSIPSNVVEFLAVDMGAMGDDQQTDEYSVSICVKDGSGPYHFGFRNHLVSLAKRNQIPYQLDIYPYYGSDASAAMKAGSDVKHALLGAGIESSHAYERTHIDSINATEKLVDCYLKSDLVSS